MPYYKESRIVNELRGFTKRDMQSKPGGVVPGENRTPVGTGLYLPNHSGIEHDRNYKKITRSMSWNIQQPNAVYGNDTQVLLHTLNKPIRILRVRCKLDASTNQVAGDLKYCTNFIGLTGATVIQAFDTTSGVSDNTCDVEVGSDDELYIQFDSEPSADIKQMKVQIDYIEK
jgi:hypothetical protein